jgi:pilus assembly protein HofP
MNKCCGFWLLWLPLALMAQPQSRDPFKPLPLPDCPNVAESPVNWQLKGTIGQAAVHHAWVVTTAGQWLRLKPQQTLLDGHWRVVQVVKGQVSLKANQGDPLCPVAENAVVLTLRNHKEEK